MRSNHHQENVANYIKDVVYAANDGIITTFAVIAGAAGATLSPSVIIILGFANLIADGFSMAASDFLASQSEQDMMRYESNGSRREKSNVYPAMITFISFVLIGALPLLPFLFINISYIADVLWISALATAVTLFIVGALRTHFTHRGWFYSGFEMLALGGVASGIAYGIGYIISGLI